MKKIILFGSLLFLMFSACKENNEFSIDVSDIDVEISVKHFEKDLFNYSIDSSRYYIDYYRNAYNDFFKLWCLQIVELGDPDDDFISYNINEFIRFWKPKQIEQILDEAFPNFKEEQLPEIENAFKHYLYYFPTKNIPELVTHFSSFSYSVVTLDSMTAIGLDKYLGPQNEDVYDKVGYPEYQKRRMIKEMIPVDIMRSTAESDFVFQTNDSDNLLDHMIYYGKIQYFLNCMLPETADTLKWMYTAKQFNWAHNHERKIWNYIADQKLLYSTDRDDIRKFTGDGPYTSAFTDVSAPRAGVFIGYKIVEKFMNNKSDFELNDLMEENDSRKILSEAKYNP
jgi:hypothetical protein